MLCLNWDYMSIFTILGNNLCDQFEMEKMVCPPKLRGELFTTTAIDSIDHNPVLQLRRTLSMRLAYSYSSIPDMELVE